MGSIGQELIRRSRERIIAIERSIAAMKNAGGFAQNIADAERELAREKSALEEKIRLEGPSN